VFDRGSKIAHSRAPDNVPAVRPAWPQWLLGVAKSSIMVNAINLRFDFQAALYALKTLKAPQQWPVARCQVGLAMATAAVALSTLYSPARANSKFTGSLPFAQHGQVRPFRLEFEVSDRQNESSFVPYFSTGPKRWRGIIHVLCSRHSNDPALRAPDSPAA